MMALASAGMVDETRLRALVRTHRVHFRATLDNSAYEGEVHPVGFVIELFASHHDAPHVPSPGCDLCAPAEAALRAIAEHVLPPPDRRSFYEVHLPHSLAVTAHDNARPELSASIEILHRNGVNDPIDDCERVCRDEIVKKLLALGACEGPWIDRPA